MFDREFALGMFALCVIVALYQWMRERRKFRGLTHAHCRSCRKPLRFGDSFQRNESGEILCMECAR